MAKAETRPHTVLITGANDGIGFQLAQAYAKRGHDVLATGRKRIKNDEEFFGTRNVTYIVADQANPQIAAKAIARTMHDIGWTQLDLAILNAGVGWTGKPEEETAVSIRDQVTVNMTAPITITSALAPWLFVGQGKLALIGSTAVKKGAASFATYSATKAGLDGFARSLRAEWKGRVDVMMIHPGPTRTAMHGKAGLNLGAVRALFMSPKRAAKAIQLAIRKGDQRRFVSRTYGWRAALSRAKEGRL